MPARGLRPQGIRTGPRRSNGPISEKTGGDSAAGGKAEQKKRRLAYTNKFGSIRRKAVQRGDAGAIEAIRRQRRLRLGTAPPRRQRGLGNFRPFSDFPANFPAPGRISTRMLMRHHAPLPCAGVLHVSARARRLFRHDRDPAAVLGQASVALRRFQRLFGPESDARMRHMWRIPAGRRSRARRNIRRENVAASCPDPEWSRKPRKGS